MSVPDCIFCKIVNGEIPSDVIFHDEHVTAFRDLKPQAPVHILIVPNRHVESLSGLGDGDEALAGKLLHVAARLAAQEKIAESGFRVVVNNGSGAGQSVFHLHLHLLGGRPMLWPPG